MTPNDRRTVMLMVWAMVAMEVIIVAYFVGTLP